MPGCLRDGVDDYAWPMAGRGSSWVVAQSVVLMATIVLIRVSWGAHGAVLHDGGIVIALAGALFFAWAYRTMGRTDEATRETATAQKLQTAAEPKLESVR